MEFERFSEELRILIQQAAVPMRERRHAFIDVEHLLLACVTHPNGAAAEIIARLQAPAAAIASDLEHYLDQIPLTAAPSDALHISPRVQLLLNRAREQADLLGEQLIGSELVLLAIGGEAGSVAAQLLERHGINQDQIAIEIVELRHPMPAESGLPMIGSAAPASTDERTFEQRLTALEAAVAQLRGEEPPVAPPGEHELQQQLQQAQQRIAELERQHHYLQDLLAITHDNLAHTRDLLARELAAARSKPADNE
ncbi:MAG TPA: Clp protease N-terminal domain-containing protein [Roseiflexaceae bacterium]|nr:Clp protease N-terminal domain-containing protein [Roseiflexaceae bacterium]HMP43076.1 Clp protease N-terminal domain-containing protein [Roseiflexaceae bacterium]